VQINVAGDLRIDGGGCSSSVDVASGTISSVVGDADSGWWFVLKLLGIAIAVVVCASIAVPVIVAVALIAGAILLTVCTLVTAVWLLGRTANLVLIIERKIGGGPDRLVYVPSVLRRDHAPPPRLGPPRVPELGFERSEQIKQAWANPPAGLPTALNGASARRRPHAP
jgi:hypothetical protein